MQSRFFSKQQKEKARRISSLIEAVTNDEITWKPSKADANCLICNIAICFEERSDDPIILVDKDSGSIINVCSLRTSKSVRVVCN